MSNFFAGKSKRIALIAAGLAVILVAAGGLAMLYRTTRKMIDLKGRDQVYFYIHTGSKFGEVADSLDSKGYLKDKADFQWLAKIKGFPEKVRPGRYLLLNGMRNNELVNLLRSGRQVPVRVTVQNIRTREELAGRLAMKLEPDSAALSDFFNDPDSLARFHVSPSTLFTLFIPNTYEFFWNTGADQLLRRMQHESDKFWTSSRRKKADSLGLKIPQIIVLASIVEKETNRDDEKPLIAGTYINRLKRGMPLQADPTVVFAWNDYTIRRVTVRHTRIDSPFNTYLHEGLPPGPICLPGTASIDAVLKAPVHRFYYFCAREDFTGYHRFAATLDEHLRNARRYQKALDARKIR